MFSGMCAIAGLTCSGECVSGEYHENEVSGGRITEGQGST